MLLSQKVGGIIYIGGEDITESLHIPTVYIDRDPRDMKREEKPGSEENYAMIECDNIQGGYLAGQELAVRVLKKLRTFVMEEYYLLSKNVFRDLKKHLRSMK